MGASHFLATWLARSAAPTGLCPPAWGCEGRATLGAGGNTSPTPTGLRPARGSTPHNPGGVGNRFPAPTQGSPLGAGNPGLEDAAPLGLKRKGARGEKLRCGHDHPSLTKRGAFAHRARSAAVSAAHDVRMSAGRVCTKPGATLVDRSTGKSDLADVSRCEPPRRRRHATVHWRGLRSDAPGESRRFLGSFSFRVFRVFRAFRGQPFSFLG